MRLCNRCQTRPVRGEKNGWCKDCMSTVAAEMERLREEDGPKQPPSKVKGSGMTHELGFEGILDVPPHPTVTDFGGKFSFLSNFYPASVTHDGVQYPTVEHAFQAAKTLDFNRRWEIAQLPTPSKAKWAGRELNLRPDWEAVKLLIMKELLVQKFFLNTALRRQLLNTGEAALVEGNNWDDTYWGVCRGRGENHLGKLLEAVREYLNIF